MKTIETTISGEIFKIILTGRKPNSRSKHWMLDVKRRRITIAGGRPEEIALRVASAVATACMEISDEKTIAAIDRANSSGSIGNL